MIQNLHCFTTVVGTDELAQSSFKCEPIDLQKLYSLEKLKYSLIFKVKIPRFLGLLYKKKTLGCPEVAVDTSKNLWQFS